MNYSLFRNITDPFILQHKRFNETLFKEQKQLIEAAQQRKRVTAMTWDLNGQRLITGSSDGYIRIYTLEQAGLSKKPIEVRLHNDEITDIVWDPSSESNFYTSARDKSIKKWDVNTKLSIPVTSGKSREENINLAISPDGKQLAVSNNKDELFFYDVKVSLDKHVRPIKMKSDINSFSWDKGEGRLFFINDQNGIITILDGHTYDNSRVALSDCHTGQCYSLAVDNANRYIATGGQDSLIGLWDLQDFLLIKTLGYNDAKVMALSLNFDGTLIASLQEDDLNKKYQIEIYDFDYENPSAIGSTVFTYTTNHEKQRLCWNPRKNILAFAGEDKDNGGVVHMLMPSQQSSTPATTEIVK